MTSWRRLALSLVALILVLVAGVSLVRGSRLAFEGFRPSAVGERRWFGWAFRGGSFHLRLAELGRRTGSGGRFYLVPGPGEPESGWLQVMAHYYAPGADVVVARPGDGGTPVGARRVSLPAAPSAEPAPGRRWPSIVALLGGLVLTIAAALPVVSLGRRAGRPIAVELPALALVTGLGGMVPPLLALRFAGVALGPSSLLATGLAVGMAFALARRALWAPPAAAASTAEESALGTWISRAAWGVLVLAFAVFVWKVKLAPLWSWDHFAIWGMKARRLAAGGAAPPDFLAGTSFLGSARQYPLGLPVAWLVLSLGRVPTVAFFKAAQLVFAGVLLLLARGAARAVGAGPGTATTLAAWVAVSPLLWDTESLGLADLPLAVWSTAALLVALRSRSWGPRWGGVAGLLAGFLPWIKEDGWTLGGLLVAALAILSLLGDETPRRRRARVAWLVLPAAAMAGTAALVAHRWLGTGVSWIAGDWQGRLVERLPRLGEIAARLGADLVRPAWIGFWLVFAAAVALAIARRRRTALLLAAVVVGQLAVYAAIFLVTYLPPEDHIKSAFFRIAAALLPLAAVALAALLAGDDADQPLVRPTFLA